MELSKFTVVSAGHQGGNPVSGFFLLFFIPSGTWHIFPSSPFLGCYFLTQQKSVKMKPFLLTSGATYYICSQLFPRQSISVSLHRTPFNIYLISHRHQNLVYRAFAQISLSHPIAHWYRWPRAETWGITWGKREPIRGSSYCQTLCVCLISARGTRHVRGTWGLRFCAGKL